jgi:hypothetical protein
MSVNKTVICDSASRMIFVFLSQTVIWVILCANLDNYPVRTSFLSSAVLPSSWLRLAGESASVDRFSYGPVFLFSSGIPLTLLVRFAPLVHLCTVIRLIFFVTRYGGSCRCGYVDNAERSVLNGVDLRQWTPHSCWLYCLYRSVVTKPLAL